MKPQLLVKETSKKNKKKHTPSGWIASFPNWLTSNDGKDVYPAACLEIFLGQETNQHCPNNNLFENKIETIQINTVNNWGAGGSSCK